MMVTFKNNSKNSEKKSDAAEGQVVLTMSLTNTFAEETYPKAVTLPEAPERRLAVGNLDNQYVSKLFFVDGMFTSLTLQQGLWALQPPHQ